SDSVSRAGRTRKVARAIRVVVPTRRYGQPQWGQAGDATTGPIPVVQILNGPALCYLWNGGGVVEDQADRDLGFAVGAEGWPVVGNRHVIVDSAALGEQVDGSGDHAVATREAHEQRVSIGWSARPDQVSRTSCPSRYAATWRPRSTSRSTRSSITLCTAGMT